MVATEYIGAVGESYTIVQNVGAGGSLTVRPAAGCEYIILGIAGTPTNIGVPITAVFTDGTNSAPIPIFAQAVASNGSITKPIVINNTCYLIITTASGATNAFLAAWGLVIKKV